jgi:hypothetical protein
VVLPTLVKSLSPTEVEDCGERAFKTHHPSAKPTNCPLRRDSLWRFAYPISIRNYYLPNTSKMIKEFQISKNFSSPFYLKKNSFQTTDIFLFLIFFRIHPLLQV